MPIRTYLILIILISSAGGVGMTYVQSQRDGERLQAETKVRQAQNFVIRLDPLESSLENFFINYDLYLGSSENYPYLSRSVKQQLSGLALMTKKFGDDAVSEKQRTLARKLSGGIVELRKTLESVDDLTVSGEQVPLTLLDQSQDASVEFLENFASLQEQANLELTKAILQGKEMGESNRVAFFISLAAFLAVAFALLHWVSRSIARPISELTAGAEAVIAEGKDFVVTRQGASEVQRLSASISHMTDSLEALVKRRTSELNETNRELNEEIKRRSESEARLLEAKTAAENANAAKSDFLAVMSHELRTPLNSILGFADVLIEGIQGEVNEEQAKSLRNISASGRHLLSLINDILDLSKIEAGKESLSVEPVGVESICRDAIGLLSRQAEKKTLHVKLRVDPRIGAIKADRRRLRQILFNLLSNAVKFTPDGKSLGLDVYLKGEDTACFTVWDEGIGISAENQEKLFQPFVQIDSKLSRKFEGTGLGLNLVKRLVEMHGGRTELESREGKGSRFHVLMPWTRQDSGDTQRSRLKEESSINLVKSPAASRPMVLLVEDNQMNQQSITQYMEAHKFDVLVADDGPTALRLAEAEDFDLILMDVQMPGMDGLDCTRELRSHTKTQKIPIIAVTALAMDGDRERCLEAGATDYMSKPLDLKRLVKLANRYTGRAEEKES